MRLGYRLPPFTRISWASMDAKAYWAPRFAQVSQAFTHIEVLTVAAGHRDACIVTWAEEDVSRLTAECVEQGLVAVPLGRVANRTGYASRHEDPKPGQRSAQRTVITRPAQAKAFVEAYATNSHDVMGRMLGYPECCRRFFEQVWVRDKVIDTTYAQTGSQEPIVAVLRPLRGANVLHRWVGCRPVAHLPCGFSCDATQAVADLFADTARRSGLGWWAEAIDDMTSWPVEWSALHGIAEVKTAVYKVIADGDAWATVRRVQVTGTHLPRHAARGLGFVYNSAPAPVDTWSANGFASADAMARAHAVIARAVDALPDSRAVLDLGCGTGELVRRLSHGLAGGVDVSATKIAQARAADPTGLYAVADVADVPAWPAAAWDVYVCSAMRLLPETAALSRAAVRTRPLVLYAYADGSQTPLVDLAQACGQYDRPVLAHIREPHTAEALVLGVVP